MQASPAVDAKGKVTLNVAPNSSGPSDAQVAGGAKAGVAKLKAWLTEGPKSTRCVAGVAGALVAIISFSAVFTDFLTLHPLRAVVNVYLVFFGAMVVLLETTFWRSCTGRCRMRLVSNAGFLAKVWGRGTFLIFVGSLCVAQHEVAHTLVGLFVVGLGIAELCVSSRASTKLQVLRAQLKDEVALRAKFAAADTDGSGTLSAEELAALSVELGSALSANELARSLELLDSDGDGVVSQDEWVAWVVAPPAPRKVPQVGASAAAAAVSTSPATSASTPAAGDGAASGAELKAQLKDLSLKNLKSHVALACVSQVVAIVLCIVGAIGCVVELCSMDLFTALIDFYIAALSGAVAAAETRRGDRADKVFVCFGRFRPSILHNFQFLLKTWGRGTVLSFCGTLAFGQLTSSENVVETLLGLVGMAATAVGMMTLLVGARAAHKLGAVKAKIAKQDDLRAAFDRFDVDQSGTLDVAELSALCASLGQHLNHSEIEEAVHVLDANRDGTVSYVEFVHWWQQGHDFSTDAEDADGTVPAGQQLAATGGNAVV